MTKFPSIDYAALRRINLMRVLTIALNFLVIMSMLAAAEPAYCDQYTWVHGDALSGEGGLMSFPAMATGTGTRVWLNGYGPGAIGNLYYVIPSISGNSWGVTKIIIKFISPDDYIFYGTSSPNLPMYINEIEVYNGNDLIKTFTGNWGGSGYQELTLDLGGKVIFDKGLGITIKLAPDPSTTSEHYSVMKIITVGACSTQGGSMPAINSLLLKK
jgi:hypothetical protein